jgi:Predicted transcriptional regulators
MDIIISNSSPIPIYEQICRQIKIYITTGVLVSGEALPSIRLLAQELHISVITTKRAYEELEREGFIETVPGKGSFVASIEPQRLREIAISRVETHLSIAIELAKSAGISREETMASLDALFEQEE